MGGRPEAAPQPPRSAFLGAVFVFAGSVAGRLPPAFT